ncbi:MAG TPA: hypothetical protein PL009_08590 [Flavipsychrobacter sp.]|nr:hypothetical protein [Flavipsychrobacter sp.]
MNFSITTLPEDLKKYVRPIYYSWLQLRLFYHHLLFNLRHIGKPVRPEDFPIIINNFNRLTSLKKLLSWLEEHGFHNIHILDNRSTYEPLINFYKSCQHKVYFLDKNYGYRALWLSGIYNKIVTDYYIYTDSDIVPIEECPADVLSHFYKILRKRLFVQKVGLSLKIDDLPDSYDKKNEVIDWESQYYNHMVDECFFKANVDTTFALYRPGFTHSANLYWTMYRSAYPYQARHLPWYTNSENPEDEELFYVSSVQQVTHWTKTEL